MAERKENLQRLGVGVIVENNLFPGRILVKKESQKDPSSGKEVNTYSIPAGFARGGESLIEAGIREVFEETGYSGVRICRFLGIYQVDSAVVAVFVGIAEGEAQGTCWKSPHEIVNGDCVLAPGMREMLIDYANHISYPLEIYHDLRNQT
ncbi:NUDIX hydrolase [Candidatus Woesebacteria bacterium]|nr:NUDIX hydrolase [Candidatus Woesebacteria bacterium]